MTLTAPTGTEIATELINTGILDPTGKDNPYSLGSNQYQQSGKLADFTSAANPVYLKFDIASGDPWIINNNIPLKNCGALALTSIQNDVKNVVETNPRRLIIIGAVLLATLAVLEVVWHRRAMEKAIKPGKRFIVAAGNPRRIIARKHGIDNYIERIPGKTMTDRTTTSSIHYAGWLKKTVKPGDKGLSIIGGHIYGKHKNGAFLKLNEFEKDDIFEVEFGNGAVRKFIVESVRLVKPADVKRVVSLQDKDIEKQVNLITFADRYDRKTRYTQERVLVIGRYKEEDEEENR
jgi:LPXTG-site transpeptidase (sortase) family protein